MSPRVVRAESLVSPGEAGKGNPQGSSLGLKLLLTLVHSRTKRKGRRGEPSRWNPSQVEEALLATEPFPHLQGQPLRPPGTSQEEAFTASLNAGSSGIVSLSTLAIFGFVEEKAGSVLPGPRKQACLAGMLLSAICYLHRPFSGCRGQGGGIWGRTSEE